MIDLKPLYTLCHSHISYLKTNIVLNSEPIHRKDKNMFSLREKTSCKCIYVREYLNQEYKVKISRV